MRPFFWAPKTYAKNYGLENIYSFVLKIFVYLKLCTHSLMAYLKGRVVSWREIV